jgi:quinolinate synthase
VLWQPSLPAEYLDASPEALADRITRRRRELADKLIILGHHYQADDVVQHADFTGDSLKLSQLAAQRVAQQGAKYVVFCGVHFMAETADLVTPDNVSVILPDLSAGCSMADMADYDEALEAWSLIHASLKARNWPGRVIPITYINSSAAIKAFVGAHGGCVCTSTNAKAVLQWALAGGTIPRKPDEPIKILFLPDQHLGRNTASALNYDASTDMALYDPRLTRRGEPLGGMTPDALLRSTMLLWAGHCSVHKLFRPEHILQIRAADADLPKPEHTRVLVHPECTKEVVDLADDSGSTEYILRAITTAPPGSRWAVGTEVHLVTRLAREAAARDVHVRILSDCQCLCTTMSRIDQPHLAWALDNLAAGRVVNAVRVHDKAREPALAAINRMLALPAPATSHEREPAQPPAPRCSTRAAR